MTQQSTGREQDARRMDATITASPVSDLFGRDTIYSQAGGAWQRTPCEEVLHRLRGMGLWSINTDRLGPLADTLDSLAKCVPSSMSGWDGKLLQDAATKVRGILAVRQYRETEPARRMGMAMLSALSVGDAARAQHNITPEEEYEYVRMQQLEKASSFS